MHRFRVWVLAAILIALAGGWLIASRMNDEDAGDERRENSARESWQDRLVDQAADGADGGVSQPLPFSALKGKAESMPPQLRQKAIKSIGGYQRLGLRFDRAQYLSSPVGGGVWVVRGDGVTCIFQPKKEVAACEIDANVARRGLVLVVGKADPAQPDSKLPTNFLAIGIAPDWARAVRLKVVGGALKRVPVTDNTFALRARSPINVEEMIR